MINNIQEAEIIAKEFNDLSSDLERLKYIKDHKNKLKVIVGVFSCHTDFICDDKIWAEASSIDLDDFENEGQDFWRLVMESSGINAEEE